jgi:predicted DNA-binding WGR domain protein
MTATDFEMIHLRRKDPALNLARYYLVTVETTLFGETVVRRRWGRIGTTGQTRTQVVERACEAADVARRIGAKKRRRGYHDVSRSE